MKIDRFDTCLYFEFVQVLIFTGDMDVLIEFSDWCEYILYVLFELNLLFSWKVLILLGFERILNWISDIFDNKKRALIGSIKGIYRSWYRINLSIFVYYLYFVFLWYMNYLEVVKSRHFMWVEQIGSKWLGYGLFTM